MNIHKPVTEYKDICGCVWRNGHRIYMCPKHRYKDGTIPSNPTPRFLCTTERRYGYRT